MWVWVKKIKILIIFNNILGCISRVHHYTTNIPIYSNGPANQGGSMYHPSICNR